ncbi:hypothetical protein, conserved [Babesia bigemina]|uniref:Uncharacterized protein n=1 Tax=Babesia bigemina TaxID=5866 RepID=A0A061DCG4_BABBI|nr:hypothetical protein, conserved [Babesia bigemina]CDR96694.1 hypothetical protein, conserved [Babesia bigemina]|eukprot:XP_012768880.1 hypothetical protein, conserved [Babesia bigemina]
MTSFDVVDSCLEYLASQPNPVQFIDVLAGVLFEQEEPELSPAAKVELWVTLCNNRDVLVITDKSDPDMIAYATQIRKSGAQALRDGQYDLQGYETSNAAGSTAGVASHHARFMRFVDSSRMFCSNTMRMKKMNLLLLESLVKSADRFRIVMAIASHRYKGEQWYDVWNVL